jgi:5-methyltetrahydropteroyltriglutamate--homocysteine methyltransferase
MSQNPGRILTSHAGSLPRPDDLVESSRARAAGGGLPPLAEEAYRRQLADAVARVVRRQRETGIDLINDGEYGHLMGQRYDYGSWWSYSFQRLGGIELADVSLRSVRLAPPKPGSLAVGNFLERRDRQLFRDAYADPASGASLPDTGQTRRAPVCTGPITYQGAEAVQRDIANLKAGMEAAGVQTAEVEAAGLETAGLGAAGLEAAGASSGFLNSVAPGSCMRFGNEYYASDEELLYACADAMREEYRAIIDAGLVLQLDDPAMAESWDTISPAPDIDDYRRFTMTRVEALNYAIRDLPAERIRFHLCWGSWHGPHVTDIPMAAIADLMLAVNASAYSFEAGNARHEHEWTLWHDLRLPPGKVILPGVVSHATNVVEHPELVAQRIVRFAEAVGRDNVVASTDCGLGGRVHPQIAWAKLDSLAQGAALATERLRH